jgi:hypothetical protein
MGRAQRRARNREDAKLEEHSKRPARDSGGEAAHRLAGEHPETQNETARRIYRTGGKAARRARKGKRDVGEKQPKWREGHQ